MSSPCPDYTALIEASRRSFLDYEVALNKLDNNLDSRHRESLTKCVELLYAAELALINAAAHQIAHRCHEQPGNWEFFAKRVTVPFCHQT